MRVKNRITEHIVLVLISLVTVFHRNQAPGLHWVLVFEPEVFSPEVSVAENSKPEKMMMVFLVEEETRVVVVKGVMSKVKGMGV